MKRVRAMLLLSALGLVAHAARADDANWKSNEPTPTTPPAISTVPVTVPTVPATPTVTAVSAPTVTVTSTPAAPPIEPSNWRPAMRYPVDIPPLGSSVPAPAPTEPVFRTTSSSPVDPPPPPVRELTPPTLPPISQIPKAIDTPRPADPPRTAPAPATRPSEQLPSPRSATPQNLPGVLGSGIVPGFSDVPPAPTTAPCPPGAPTAGAPSAAVPAAGGVPPTRARVFGSPSLNLSRDFFVRDLFGLDLYSTPRGSVGPDGAVLLDGPSTDLFFFQAEYLFWWTNRYQVPVLATTSTTPTGFGFLGDPNTRTLLGPGNFGPSFRNGMRIRGGGFFDECEPTGFDGSFFFLGTARQQAAFDSGQYPVITRPFFAPNSTVINAPAGTVFLPGEFGEVVARPGLSTGRLQIDTSSYLWGADLNYKCAICRTCEGGRGWFTGFRFVSLSEQLQLTEFITATGAQATDPPGTQVVVGDSFKTQNQFYGGQVGYYWNRRAGRWDVDARASVALGVTHQILDIDGFQQRTRPGQATQNFQGGLLATGPNLGRFTDNRFGVVPEGTLNVGYMLNPSVKLYVGYNVMYWSSVIRPGDQIDRTVDLTLVPNPPANVPPSGQFRPQPTFKQSDLWVQGVQLGVELRW